jgi:hypothetical protein
MVIKQKFSILYSDYSELPHTDLRYSVGFPIHQEKPLELCSSMGLTFPPRAEVLIPKTQIFLL